MRLTVCNSISQVGSGSQQLCMEQSHSYHDSPPPQYICSEPPTDGFASAPYSCPAAVPIQGSPHGLADAFRLVPKPFLLLVPQSSAFGL